MKTFYNDQQKLITVGIIFMLIGFIVPMVWADYLEYAFGIIFGAGLSYFSMGMHKKYNNK